MSLGGTAPSQGRVWTQCAPEIYEAMPQQWLRAFASYSGRIYMLARPQKTRMAGMAMEAEIFIAP